MNSLEDALVDNSGLYIGKFDPFHIGHEYVIRVALSMVDKLYVIVTNSPTYEETVSLYYRRLRIRDVFPLHNLEVIDGYNPPEDDYSPEGNIKYVNWLKGLLPDTTTISMVFGNESYVRDIAHEFHANSFVVGSEFYPGVCATNVREEIKRIAALHAMGKTIDPNWKQYLQCNRVLHPTIRDAVIESIYQGYSRKYKESQR